MGVGDPHPEQGCGDLTPGPKSPRAGPFGLLPQLPHGHGLGKPGP